MEKYKKSRNDISIITCIKEYGKLNILLYTIGSALVLLFILILICLYKYLSSLYIINNLAKLENKLYQFIITVPNAYRNSDKMALISRIYYTKPDIDPTIIIDSCDEYIYKHNIKSLITSIMFDLPCNCQFLNLNINTTNQINSKIKEDICILMLHS